MIFRASRMGSRIARFGYAAAFLLIVSYAFFTLRGPKGIPGLIARQHQIEQLEKQNAVFAADNERIREHIQRLTDNPEAQDLEIRQRLKLVHPGEKVYILNNK